MEEIEGQPTIVHEALSGYRVAVESYGALSPIKRPFFFIEDVGAWNRFDTPGRTLYAAKSHRGALTECLYGMRMGHDDRTAITFMAEAFSISREEAFQLYADEQESQGHPAPGILPPTWRENRLLYHLSSTKELAWFDLSTAHSLTFIDHQFGSELYKTCGVRAIDLSHLQGENRRVTTLIATKLRNLRLNDGGFADGIRFNSRHGSGLCWAFWMRRTDDDLDDDLVHTDTGVAIKANDPELAAVAKRFGLQVQ